MGVSQTLQIISALMTVVSGRSDPVTRLLRQVFLQSWDCSLIALSKHITHRTPMLILSNMCFDIPEASVLFLCEDIQIVQGRIHKSQCHQVIATEATVQGGDVEQLVSSYVFATEQSSEPKQKQYWEGQQCRPSKQYFASDQWEWRSLMQGKDGGCDKLAMPT